MNRFDRILGILLLLRSSQSVSAADMARRFGVATRTVYRDIETLSALGVPVYAQRGQKGGFRLLEGYVLPPLMFTKGEAISLLLGLTLLRSLRAQPFPAELETAERKLLAAVPLHLRAILAEAQKIVGFENTPVDIFHPELDAAPATTALSRAESGEAIEGRIVSTFLQALLEGRSVRLQYNSPYAGQIKETVAEPYGVFWDRDHWYLAGRPDRQTGKPRVWRAERVLTIRPDKQMTPRSPEFDVRQLLGRHWLKTAMKEWVKASPVQIRLSGRQAERLQQDWYYQHARFEQVAEDEILMTFGEDNQAVVLALLRWLGPGAELIAPEAWRRAIQDELKRMLADYGSA
jgi:predicted DNA-binding transcriptional regulator YafY